MRGLIIGIALFFSLVLTHEFGHFVAAKRSGVKVLEFGIGIPPKICTLFKDKSWTKYTLNALPFGGFVRLKGEDPQKEEEFHAPDSFVKAKIHKKIIILLGWVFMNFLTAWILFTFVFTRGTSPISILPENAVVTESNSYLMPTLSFLDTQWFLKWNVQNSPALVGEVFPWNLWEDIGLLSGDLIVNINNTPVNARNIWWVLKDRIWKEVVVNVNRDGISWSGTGYCPEDSCLLWVALETTWALSIATIKYPFKDAIFVGLKEIVAETNLTLHVLWNLGANLLSFNGHKIKWSLDKLTWPAWAIKFGKVLLAQWWRVVFLAFAGIISLALAIFNVLPIPALDGWRLLWVLIQWIGRLKPKKYFNIEWYINIVFFVLLLGLWVYILLKDLVRFWGVHIPFMG